MGLVSVSLCARRRRALQTKGRFLRFCSRHWTHLHDLFPSDNLFLVPSELLSSLRQLSHAVLRLNNLLKHFDSPGNTLLIIYFSDWVIISWLILIPSCQFFLILCYRSILSTCLLPSQTCAVDDIVIWNPSVGRADYRAVFVCCIVPLVANMSGFPVGIVSGCDSNERSAQCCFKTLWLTERCTLQRLLWLMVKSPIVWALNSCTLSSLCRDVLSRAAGCFSIFLSWTGITDHLNNFCCCGFHQESITSSWFWYADSYLSSAIQRSSRCPPLPPPLHTWPFVVLGLGQNATLWSATT